MNLCSENDRNLPARAILLRIRNDEPSLEQITISLLPEQPSDPWHEMADFEISQLGQDIGSNTQLKWVEINCISTRHQEDDNIVREAIDNRLRPLLTGVDQNRSIKKITLIRAGTHASECFFCSLSQFLAHNNNLHSVNVFGCNFEPKSARILVDALLGRQTPLGKLTVTRGSNNIVAVARSFDNIVAALLEYPQSSPSGLCFIDIGADSGARNTACCIKIAELLRKPDCTLKKLEFVFAQRVFLWGLILDCVCDTSSINATYFSNHTLEGYVPQITGEMFDLLRRYLSLNRNPDKKLVAPKKVAMCHFNDNFQMDSFVGMVPDLLVRVVKFIDNANEGVGGDDSAINISDSNRLSILLQLTRYNPLLCFGKGVGDDSTDVSSVMESME